MATFAKRLQELRTDKNISIRELARQVGYAHNSISMWEREKTKPTLDAITTLAKYFKVSTDYLTGVTDD